MNARDNAAYPRIGPLGSAGLILAFLLTGCQTTPTRPDTPAAPTAADYQPPATVVDARPAAMISGRSLHWADLRPTLTEMAGGRALQEVMLDRAVARGAKEQAVVVTDEDVSRERAILVESLHEDSNRALILLGQLRDREGLGRTRFNGLLRRNAALRAMVRDEVDWSEEAVRRAFEIRYGPKRQARLIIVPDLPTAQSVIARALAGERFGDIAVELSTDSSAARGGLLAPISRLDPSYPESLRQGLWSLQPGETSQPVLLENQYAVLFMVRDVDAEDVRMDDVRERLEREVRLGQERILMDALAKRYLDDISVTIFDDYLHDSWNRWNRIGR